MALIYIKADFIDLLALLIIRIFKISKEMKNRPHNLLNVTSIIRHLFNKTFLKVS